MTENNKNTDPILDTICCPQCRTPKTYHAHNPFRPFCSERCRLIDLGAWASDRYAIPTESPPDFDDENDVS